MATQDIQEMLEGMLNDEQTAEVLHRLSVSPEKLSAFRQHMALRGAFEEDARIGELNDEEDDAVWAAVLGATGGLVTGGAAVGASGWLAKAAALLVTGLAGFFIGTAVDGTLFTSDETPVMAEKTEQADRNVPIAAAVPSASSQQLAAATATPRIDTVIRTVVEYRDRVIEVKVPTEKNSSNDAITAASVTTPPSNQARPSTIGSPVDIANQVSPTSENVVSENLGISPKALAALQNLHSSELSAANSSSTTAVNTTTLNNSPAKALDPNEALHERSPSKSEDDPSLDKPTATVSLMRNGFELGYSERLGRITALPRIQGESEPNYSGRAVELTGRMLNGKVGIGTRLIYGSFSTVTLKEEIQNIGFADTLLVPSLESTSEFDIEVFANYRIPLFTERFAIGLEGTFGLSSTRFKASGDLLATYLITNQIGVQGGVGYGLYHYTTQQVRESRLDQYENASITDDFIDFYEGTQIEGRYGLFFRF